MKKKIFALFAVPMVLVGLSSCNKTVSEFDATNGETGTLKLNVTFASTGLTKASVSDNNTMRPTSTWADVNSLMLIVCNSEDEVVARTEVPLNDFTQTGTSDTYYFTNIPVGSGYTVYAIANYTTDATTAWTYGYGGLPSGDFSLPNNGDIPGFLDIDEYTVYNGVPNVGYTVPTVGTLFSLENAANFYSVYSAAPNYFVGKATNVEVEAAQDANETIELVRPVNLVRVKVKLSEVNVDAQGNAKITFDTEDASMVLRRVNTAYNFVGGEYTSASTTPEYNVSFAPGPFTRIATLSGVPSGYTGTALTDDSYTWYKDMLAFPPTNYSTQEIESIASNLGDRYPNQLRLSLYATVANGVADYQDSDGVIVEPGTVVSFSADAAFTDSDYENLYNGNVIITLNVELKSNGNTGGEPPVNANSNMNVTVELSDWEYEVETEIII